MRNIWHALFDLQVLSGGCSHFDAQGKIMLCHIRHIKARTANIAGYCSVFLFFHKEPVPAGVVNYYYYSRWHPGRLPVWPMPRTDSGYRFAQLTKPFDSVVLMGVDGLTDLLVSLCPSRSVFYPGDWKMTFLLNCSHNLVWIWITKLCFCKENVKHYLKANFGHLVFLGFFSYSLI